MCGGSNEIKETPEQKELARIAMERWNKYKEMYLPAEQHYFDRVEAYDSDAYQARVGGMAAANVESAFGEAVQTEVDMLAAEGTGVEPMSGKFTGAMSDITEQHGSARTANVNESQQALQDSHIGGMQNIVAMGNNQSTQAITGFGDIANRSSAVARNDARVDAYGDASKEATAGLVAGAGYGSYQNMRDEDRQDA